MEKYILTINGGSSSIKFSLYSADGSLTQSMSGKIDRIGLPGSFLVYIKGDSKEIVRETPLADFKAAVETLNAFLGEQVDFNKEIERLKKFVGGLGDLRKIPDAVFILDAKKEKTAIIEARKKQVPVVGFCDSNINPELFDYPIPANDDAVRSIELITKLAVEAIQEGKAKLII